MTIGELKARIATIPDHVEITSRQYHQLENGWTSDRGEVTEMTEVYFEGDGSDLDTAVFLFRIDAEDDAEDDEPDAETDRWTELTTITAAVLLAARVSEQPANAMLYAANLIEMATHHRARLEEELNREAQAKRLVEAGQSLAAAVRAVDSETWEQHLSTNPVILPAPDPEK